MKQNSLFLKNKKMLASMFLNLTYAPSNPSGHLLIASRLLTFRSTFSCTYIFLPLNSILILLCTRQCQSCKSARKYILCFFFLFNSETMLALCFVLTNFQKMGLRYNLQQTIWVSGTVISNYYFLHFLCKHLIRLMFTVVGLQGISC